MRLLIFIVLLALSGLVLAAPTNANEKLKPWQQKALQLLQQEKKVVDAWWRDPEHNVLFVAMKPDGYRKDGFAEYICITLGHAGAPKGMLRTVWVYDPATFRAYKERTGSGSSMGMAACR